MKRFVTPTLIVLLAHLIYLSIILFRNNLDPLAFAKIGDTVCTGYDGQFTYFIARDPFNLQSLISTLDVPAYRYQRILLPMLARALALGNVSLIAWTIPLINLIAHTLGTYIVERLLIDQGVSRWYALVYGLWAGLSVSVRTDIAEPLSYGLVAAAYLADSKKRITWSAVLLGLAVFAKETAALFIIAQIAHALFTRNRPRIFNLLSLIIIPFTLWQVILYQLFGSFGVGSGGCMGTPFEIIPFMGVWRIASSSLVVFVVYLLFLIPWIMLPSLWGIVAAAREVLKKNFHPYVWALGVNAAIIPFTPFSTFREPVAIFRFACGLVLATLLFASLVKSRRVLNYSWLWLAMWVFLIKD